MTASPRRTSPSADAPAAVRIRCHAITKYYGRATVLDEVDVQVHAGEMVALIGPGGAGKSLLAKIMCGLVRPDAGHVFIDQDDLVGLSEPALQRVRARMGMVFQNYALFDFMNVADNLALPLRMTGERDEARIAARVAELLEQVALPGIQEKLPAELSGGMKKRVSFARAVIREPPIVIYDDPTAGLDPVTSAKIFRLLEDMQSRGTTSVVISHDLDGIRPLCDRWVLIDRGRVVLDGDADAFERSSDLFVRQFWHGEVS